ncbi:formylglycine-generating enzyme family protein [Williamsia herbipolensis]|uniref:Formylglycine-generating enzyme family protein n=1 Tax=Williamsia herbipolensis TaxID=1603258 RepID=A0AAU4K1F1_9NOCA|nr:formylglycine-generating enzyme family protein [Williamsia herbipolensis]
MTGFADRAQAAPCCSPAADTARAIPDALPVTTTGAHRVAQRPLAGGRFEMGDAHSEGVATDGETPCHAVTVAAFAMDETTVRTSDFAAFVDDTGYRTTAERAGSSAVFHALVDPASVDVLGAAPAAPWWWEVRGADWRHPFGPGPDLRTDLADHPVVHVSHDDALAYCRWASRALPTEAQWEYAARGGLEGTRFAWGDDRTTPSGAELCHIYDPARWGSAFPAHPGSRIAVAPTLPGDALPPNGFGLRQMSGNVWEWCSDRFDPRWYRRSPTADPSGPDRGATRVLRGGSYLCDDSYCRRYRVAARSHTTPASSAGNIGFRTVSST